MTTVQLGGDITKESEKNTNRGIEKKLTRLKKCMAKENIISAVIHVDETTPHLCDLARIDQRESIGERRDSDKRKCAGRKGKFLEAMQEKGASYELHVWSRA